MIDKILLLLIFTTAFVVIEASAQTETYHLTVRASPNILFLGGGGDYNAGAVVTLEPAPQTWQDYTFLGWKVDGRWSVESPPTIRMDRAHTVEAVYDKTNVVGGLIIDTLPRVVEIAVDGKRKEIEDKIENYPGDNKMYDKLEYFAKEQGIALNEVLKRIETVENESNKNHSRLTDQLFNYYGKNKETQKGNGWANLYRPTL